MSDPTGTSSSVTVALSGDLDLASDAAVRRRLVEETSSGVVIADLADVGFMDSSGLRAMLEARLALEHEGRALAITNVPHQVSRLLEIAGTSDLFERR